MSSKLLSLPNALREVDWIGIGEPLHGSTYIHQQYCSLVKLFLKSSYHLEILLENPEVDTAHINSWIQGKGSSSIEKFSSKLYSIWRTPAFLALLRFLRKANMQKRNKVTLRGYDIRQVEHDLNRMSRSRMLRQSTSEMRKTFTFNNRTNWKEIENFCLDGSAEYIRHIQKDLKIFRGIKVPSSIQSEYRRVVCWLHYLSVANRDWGTALALRDKLMYDQLTSKRPSSHKTLLIGHCLHLLPRSSNQQPAQSDYCLGSMMGELLAKKKGNQYRYIHLTRVDGRIGRPRPRTVERQIKKLSAIEQKSILAVETLQFNRKGLLLSDFSVSASKCENVIQNQVVAVRATALRNADFLYLE